MSKFLKGESGNPRGRPKGVVSRKSQFAKLLEPHAEDLVAKAVELAKQGEPMALRLCLERLIPRAKDDSVCMDISNQNLNQLETLLDLEAKVINSIAEGEITLEQGQNLMILLKSHRETLEIVHMESRVKQIENVLKIRK